MLPTTKETNKRIKSLMDLTYTNASPNVSGSDDMSESDSFHSFENTFSSSEFQTMYTKPSQDDTKTEPLSYLWTYPFENELSKSSSSSSMNHVSKGSNVYICLYRICKGANGIPYLQYKLKLTNAKSKKKQPHFVFPSISISAASLIKRADDYVANTIHCERFEYKGMCQLDADASQASKSKQNQVYSGMGGKRKMKNSDDDNESDSSSTSSSSSYDDDSISSYSRESGDSGEPGKAGEGDHSVYLFYYDNTDTGTSFADSSPVSVTSKTEWYWSCIHEIFNARRVLRYRVGRSVSALFVHNPTALFIINKAGIIYETPHVLYKGLPPGISMNEMCKFGPRIHI